MQPVDCFRPPCPTIPPVNVPGSAGANAYTFTTASFVVPSPGSDVVVQVLNTSGLTLGASVILTGPAHFNVISLNGPTTVTLAFQNQAGDIASGTIIQSGAAVIPTGQPGAAGAAGENGYALTTSSFVVPSVGNTVTVPVNNSGCFVVGQPVIATGPANFLVTALPAATSVTLQFSGNPNDVAPGTTINSGSTITAGGVQGQNAYTTLTAQLTVPAVGSTVTAAVVSTAWMVVGEPVVLPGPSTYSVTTIVSATSVVLTNLGYTNNLAPGNFIVNGSGITPSGTQPSPTSSQSSFSSGTVYTLTGASAQIVFGTTTPQLTLPNKGTWVIFSTAVINLNSAASIAGSVVINLQRSNNTPGALPNASVTLAFNNSSAGPGGFDAEVVIPYIYQSSAGDVIQLYGMESTSEGSTFLTVSQASMAAYQIA